MAAEKFLKYTLEEIGQFHNGRKSLEEYKIKSQKLKVVYENMMDDIYTDLIKYRQQSIMSTVNNKHHDQNDNFEGRNLDWHECNSVDSMDGSKYIGYYRREYQDSQFGSFPIHDDYGEES